MRNMSQTSEAAFETVIETYLLQDGYVRIKGEGFDRERTIFPDEALTFVRETQPKEWAKLERFARRQDRRAGARRSVQVDGHSRRTRYAPSWVSSATAERFARPTSSRAHELNPELQARYAANRLGLTRQLHFSPNSEKSLDVTR